MNQFSKPPSPQPQPARTDPLPSSRRTSRPPWCIVTELRDLTSGRHYRLPNILRIDIGRDDDNDVVLKYSSVSRVHAHAYPESDHLLIHDAGSTNKTFVGSTEVKSFQLIPGGIICMGEAELLALSELTAIHAAALDRLVGSTVMINAALCAPRERRCLAFVGPEGSCLDQIVAASHGAASEGRTPLVMRTPTRLPADDAAIRALVDEVEDGWLVLDLRNRPRGVQPNIDHALLQQLLSKRQRATVAFLLESDDESPKIPELIVAWQPAKIVVPSIGARITGDGLRKLVDQIYKADQLELTYDHLHRDVADALRSATWGRNFEQFFDVLVYSGRRRVGHPNAGEGLLTCAQNALYWIDCLGLDRRLWGMP